MFRLTALITAAALAVGLAACGGSSYSSGSSSSKSASTTSAASSGGGKYGAGGGKSEVEQYDNYFKPKVVSGTPGSTIKIELKNEGTREHNFTVDSQKIDKDLEAGKDATVSVKIPASGSVQFYCTYHKSLGMTGTLKAS